MINHHLSDKLLMAYSAGSLPEAFNLAVATHIALCDECRARLASFDALGGVILEEASAPDVSMESSALSATLERVKTGKPTPRARQTAPQDALLPAPLRDYVGDPSHIRWRSLGGGAKQMILATTEQATARLLLIPAGTKVPDHSHGGLELTLVLQGAFADEHDRFGRGDIEIADESTHHQPIAEPGEDCICLAVTDAPLRFRGLLPRLAQPFLGI